MKLYDIIEGLRAIEAEIDRDNGELTPDTEAALSGLEASLEVKADNIAALIVEAQHAAEALGAEADRFSDRARAQRNKSIRLLEWLRDTLEAAGRDKVKGARFNLAVQQNSAPSIRWDGEPWTMPAEYTRTRVEPDGDKIRAAYDIGMLAEGFTVKRGTHLRIR